jgi:hypothetical protein
LLSFLRLPLEKACRLGKKQIKITDFKKHHIGANLKLNAPKKTQKKAGKLIPAFHDSFYNKAMLCHNYYGLLVPN